MALFQTIINPYVDNIDDVLARRAPNLLTGTIFLSPTRLILTFADKVAAGGTASAAAPLGPVHKPITPAGPKH